jgi:hypothetical protein
MKRCVTCHQTLELGEFNRKASAPDGLQNVCRECNRASARRYYRDNREKHLAVIARRTREAKARARSYVGEYLLTHPCVDCGEADIRVLDFDHVPTRGKTKNVMELVNLGFSIERIRAEIERCDVRCRNCHARVTSERRQRDWRSDLVNRHRGRLRLGP